MHEPETDKDGKKRRIRCAVYTRKSTTEGLEKEFNSLDAQREACEKYVESQKGEGWVLWPTRYDDGGFTGGNTERPALRKLLADIRSGAVDTVVVYKVDRLSRSLMDFAQLIQLFESHGVAFVSVTQQFNTNNSMGRLTLNVLLSFAQFEREIISERIKDKMGAARKRGKWLGGPPPMGYDLDREKRKLVVNEAEALIVREIYDLYLEHRSLLEVVRILNARGIRSKVRKNAEGVETGGKPFKLTNLQYILANPVYTGHTRVGAELFPGEHAGILPLEVYRAVEEIRKANRVERSVELARGEATYLKGLLHCRSCDCAMIHSYTQKRGRRYRYYLCMRAKKQGHAACPNPTVNAMTIEEAAGACLKKVMEGQQGLREFFARTWDNLFPTEKARIFRTALRRVEHDGVTGSLKLVLSERGVQSLLQEISPAKDEVA